ncbi:MAG: tRNA pseudouridine(38-40) synthase TruA [Candidatus Omnitrophota bacterium]|nr:tRNA pseudouridine(38-40) synthase TruA [Candidatus Omnitrophota bacterium]
MRNIKLTLEYEGTNFCGWQTQKVRSQKSEVRSQRRTVQETLENALKRILNEKIKLIGSGRTDSGAHALGQVANFKTNSRLSVADIKRALNAVLPADIAIKKIEEAPSDFHSRFDVKSKIYRYTILNSPIRSVMQRNFYYFYPYKLNLNAMRQAARLLLGRKDFKSFQVSDKRYRSSKRHIKNISLKKEGNFINFDIEADGFLYKMVRSIVGTLMEVGQGKLKPKDLQKILIQKNRKFAGPTVPAKGLTLVKVIY